jgi:ParB family transcriptional regulator, chromosome partitioning protein
MSISTSNNAGQNAVQELRELAVERVVPNPSQPRRRFDEEALQGLAGSMGECGVLQPVLVRPSADGKYELVAGERRWRAAKIAGLEKIPALVSAYDDAEALEVALIENVAREDLNPVEEARACATLVNEFGLSQEEIGRRVGRSRSVVNSLIGLLRLSDEILELVERGELSWNHGASLLSVEDLDARLPLARAAIAQGWTVQTLQRYIRASKVKTLEPGDSGEPALDQGQQQDLAALEVARAWGELLGAEVHVRSLPHRRLRLELTFGSAAEGIALADRLAAAIARGSKGR